MTGTGIGMCNSGIFSATLEMDRAGTKTGWSGSDKFGNTGWNGGSDFGTIALGGNFLINVVRTSDKLLIAERVASTILEKSTAGAGLKIAWVNDLIAMMALSSEERKGMSQWCGKIRLCLLCHYEKFCWHRPKNICSGKERIQCTSRQYP